MERQVKSLDSGTQFKVFDRSTKRFGELSRIQIENNPRRNEMIAMLNKLEAAIQDYNDLLDSVLFIHLNDGNFSPEYFCLKDHQWKPMPDWGWKANGQIPIHQGC